MVRQFLVLIVICFVHKVSAENKTILVMGDSLSAGYGISVKQGWVSLLQGRLDEQGYPYQVINASISGDTTSGANARLDNHLKDSNPDIVIIELGGNDGLRGLPLDEMYRNLSDMITRMLDNDIQVLLIPIQIPPNYGQIYTTKFQEVYQRLENEHDVVMGKFLLEGIALDPGLMQADGIHPVAEAQIQVLDNVWPELKSIIEEREKNKES